jgi:hypothetical protein
VADPPVTQTRTTRPSGCSVAAMAGGREVMALIGCARRNVTALRMTLRRYLRAIPPHLCL